MASPLAAASDRAPVTPGEFIVISTTSNPPRTAAAMPSTACLGSLVRKIATSWASRRRETRESNSLELMGPGYRRPAATDYLPGRLLPGPCRPGRDARASVGVLGANARVLGAGSQRRTVGHQSDQTLRRDDPLDAVESLIEHLGIERVETFVEEERLQPAAMTRRRLGEAEGQGQGRQERLAARERVGTAHHVTFELVDDVELPVVAEPIPLRHLVEAFRGELRQQPTPVLEQEVDEVAVGEVVRELMEQRTPRPKLFLLKDQLLGTRHLLRKICDHVLSHPALCLGFGNRFRE